MKSITAVIGTRPRREFADPVLSRRILANMHDSYLNARSSETVAEQPLLLTEDQGYLSYYKAPHALFALQELIGADKVNGALRAYYSRFAEMKPPFIIDYAAECSGSQYMSRRSLAQWLPTPFI